MHSLVLISSRGLFVAQAVIVDGLSIYQFFQSQIIFIYQYGAASNNDGNMELFLCGLFGIGMSGNFTTTV